MYRLPIEENLTSDLISLTREIASDVTRHPALAADPSLESWRCNACIPDVRWKQVLCYIVLEDMVTLPGKTEVSSGRTRIRVIRFFELLCST